MAFLNLARGLAECAGGQQAAVDALRSVDMPGLDLLPLGGRVQMGVLARLPVLRDVGRILRYRF